MPEEKLCKEERAGLLRLAREALEKAVKGEPVLPVDPSEFSPRFAEDGATFVTLTYKGNLRGCIGALEAYQPLVEDVREHAIAAGLHDYRFRPVQPEELPDIRIEISRLTPPVPLQYDKPMNLPAHLRPGIDGVLLKDGVRRATFLPQVWESLPEPEEFLAHLCYKMGASPDLWKHKKLDVFIYQVEEFHE